MSYLALNNRQKAGKLIAYCNFKDGSFVNLIKLDQSYKNGIKYAVYETTKSPFLSNGLFKDVLKAFDKYNLMVRNGSQEFGIRTHGLLNRPEAIKYLNS